MKKTTILCRDCDLQNRISLSALLGSVGYEFNKHFSIGIGGGLLSAAFCINMFHIVSFLFSVTRPCDSTIVAAVKQIRH